MSLSTQGLGELDYFSPDIVFNNTALPNGAGTTSSAFKFGGSLLGSEIVGVADTEITLATAQTLVYALTTCDTYAGSFTADSTIVTKTHANSPIATGTELFRFAGNTNTKLWAKVVVTTTDNQSSDKHTVSIQRVPNC
jgi:hypothetical protein